MTDKLGRRSSAPNINQVKLEIWIKKKFGPTDLAQM